MKGKNTFRLAALCVGVWSAVGSQAQVLEEVVVTAQKRIESIQDVPISIVAISEDKLEKARIINAEDLSRIVPNLRINRQAQASATAIRIRGVGASGNNAIDPSVAPFLDGVYIARGGAILSSFLDVSNVEVLRGPQGTLFGRNATTGAIQISTHQPDFDAVSGSVFAEYGNYDSQRLRGIVNVPVTDTFALRVAGLVDKRDGYFDNLLDGESYSDRDALTARISARWQPNDSVDWTVRVDYAEMGGDGAAPAEVSSHQGPATLITSFGSAFGPLSADISDPFDSTVSQRVYADFDDTQWGVSSDLNWDMPSDYRVRWIASVRSWDNKQLDGDNIYTGMDFVNRYGFYDSESTSQELQLISPEDGLFGGKMDFVAGLYYFQEDYELGEDLNLGTNFCSELIGPLVGPQVVPVCQALPQTDATEQVFTQDAQSIAAFLETNWQLSESVELKLGVRYTQDDKESGYSQLLNNAFAAALRVPEEVELDFDDSQVTYRAVLSWFLNENLMLFTNYSTGYKSGGINSNGSSTPLFDDRIFDSEQVQDIELGFKSTLLDGRMQLNATAYRMEIDDFQDRTFKDASFIVTNAGSLRQQGLELELKAAATDNLTFDLGLAYLDSEFTDFRGATALSGCAVLPIPGTPECPNPQDNTGKRGTFSPEWEVTIGVEHVRDLDNGMTWTSGLNWQYVDDQFAGGTELSPQTIAAAYDLLDARVTLSSRDDTWRLSAFGQNLTDERYETSFFTQVLGSALGLVDTTTGDGVYRHYLSAPRTYGVSVEYRF